MEEDVHERLYEAVKKHSGMEDEEILQVAEHGADTGHKGFTTYEETGEFYAKYGEDIWEMLADQAEEMGESPLAMIAGFKIAPSIESIDTFENALSWYALEEIANWLEAEEEEEEEDDGKD